MIRGSSQGDHPINALRMFDKMRDQGDLHGNNLTFIFVLKACTRVSDILYGTMIHANVIKLGFESYLYVCNALIYMYSSCYNLSCARFVFDKMSDRDLVSWNSLICGYSHCNRYKEVLSVFNAMREENVEADSITMVKVIFACSHLGDVGVANSVVNYIADNCIEIDVYLGNTLIDMYGRFGSDELARELFDLMPERNVVSWNAMITGYVKVGNLFEARKLFDEMPKKDVISWTSMITGYSHANQFSDALQLFKEMMMAKVRPDEITIASVISVCAHIGRLDIGKAVHDYIHECNIKVDMYVGNSLIDMYCKCGSVETAVEVFRGMKEKDSVSWTSIISGLAVNGRARYALDLFSEMIVKGFEPTHGTFVGVLLACAHAGLVEEGMNYFEDMQNVFKLVPEMKHYGCVVDLLSRYGYLERAYDFIKRMPTAPDIVVWRMFLSGCKLHGNVVLADIATKQLLKFDPCDSGNYVLSSNAYAGADRWEDAEKMRDLMEECDVLKPSGWSSLGKHV